jgi:antitoxin MazE
LQRSGGLQVDDTPGTALRHGPGVECETSIKGGHDAPEISGVLPLCLQRKEGEMEVAIRKMGNSQGILIPKPILAQVGLEGTADLQVRDGVIEIRPIRRNPREGWAEDAQRLAEEGADALVWPELPNEGDEELVW